MGNEKEYIKHARSSTTLTGSTLVSGQASAPAQKKFKFGDLVEVEDNSFNGFYKDLMGVVVGIDRYGEFLKVRMTKGEITETVEIYNNNLKLVNAAKYMKVKKNEG